eukprot:jgi/Psemu1/4667/gm1.4667_g
MVFSKLQILQALQVKINSQQIAPTNPVDPNPSVPPSATSPSQQEDDGIDLELLSDLDSDSDSDFEMFLRDDPGWGKLLLLHGICCQDEDAYLDSDSEEIDPDDPKWDYISVQISTKPNVRKAKDFPVRCLGIRVRKVKDFPVWCLRRIRKIDTGVSSILTVSTMVIYKFADDILIGPYFGWYAGRGRILIDNSTVMATQIVPQEDSPLITMVLNSRTNCSNKSSKAISSCSSYSLDPDP